MASTTADIRSTAPPRPATSPSNTTNPPSASATRHRFVRRQSSNPKLSPSPHPRASPELLHRRSSILSDITEDLINPTASRSQHRDDAEVTHWHSTPLAFAILPAVGGLLFKNGSAFVTDVLLLGLAAVFMNWSIRIPWDWYYCAQTVRRDVEPDASGDGSGSGLEDTIPEEAEEEALETDSGAGGSSPEQVAADRKATNSTSSDGEVPMQNVSQREEATADLRKQERLALAATFLFPALAAYLLHVIRAQLSRPSTGLVSDYNLSIFLLAAEIRPARQLVRLIANRTLHLQRAVSGIDDPFMSTLRPEKSPLLTDLTSRLSDIEARLSEHQIIPPTVTIAAKSDVSDLSAEMRKRYEPRLEGLERAVRRYEKRSTTLAMLTDQRLNSLESRLQDALSLAAVAAQHSQQKRSVFAWLLETVSAMIAFPMKVAWSICVWPLVLVDDLYAKIKILMLGPAPQQRSAKRRPANGGSREGSMDEKPKLKSALRKIVR